MDQRISFPRVARTSWLLSAACLLFGAQASWAQTETVKDDFEDAEWQFIHNWPKSSHNVDKQWRQPSGGSKNGLWSESMKRGQPDYIKRVETPAGGLPGSKGALLMRTLYSGIPDAKTGGYQQDDLIFNAAQQTGVVPVGLNPTTVVRVYVPPWKKWEQRTGTTFGFRTAVDSTTYERKRGFLSIRRVRKAETLYPGMFVQFNCKADGAEKDSAILIVRADTQGQDFFGPEIKPGWWTLGMSFSGDGRIHYYARAGVKQLTAADRFASEFPWGQKMERFSTIFFNVCNSNSGRSWSTPWIIDDPTVTYSR